MIQPRRHHTISVGGDLAAAGVVLLVAGVALGAAGGWVLARRWAR